MLARQSEAPSEEASLAVRLFIRGLSSFQSAILLAERGMIQDARTIARSCFETVFCFGALRKDRDFLGKFEKADLHSKKLSFTACLYLVVWTAERVEHPEIKEDWIEEYKQLIEAAWEREPAF